MKIADFYVRDSQQKMMTNWKLLALFPTQHVQRCPFQKRNQNLIQTLQPSQNQTQGKNAVLQIWNNIFNNIKNSKLKIELSSYIFLFSLSTWSLAENREKDQLRVGIQHCRFIQHFIGQVHFVSYKSNYYVAFLACSRRYMI